MLRRRYNLPNVMPPAVKQPVPAKIGFSDPRFNLELPEGFEVFRTYKGKEYRAKAVNGMWLLLSTGDCYPSFNQLGKVVSGNVENAWNNWYFLAKDGTRRLVDELRNPSFGHGFTR
jgi:hypothetical protein